MKRPRFVPGSFNESGCESLVSPVAEKPEQIKEQVDKVQVQSERSEEAELFGRFTGMIYAIADVFYFLHVVCSKSGKDRHANKAEDVIHCVAFKEHVHQSGND